ncbi:TatD family hydrolase, partial [Patescibacteria group bacterium]|nr:TatD family hydrolase [Patescibacteria group bacterium]
LIHTRQAFAPTVEILSRFSGLRGVFHCYSAGKKGIEPVNKLGFYFGFDGNLTYDEGLQKIANLIPLTKIILETDAPFLSPKPYRKKRNEPAYLVETAKILAEVKKVSLAEIEETTTQNAHQLFNF